MFRLIVFLCCGMLANLSMATPTPEQIMEALDSAGGQLAGSEKIILLAKVVNGLDAETRRFKILDNGKGASLVEFLDPSERGQKVLSTEMEMWFLAPGSRRAIKVPPIQRAFGDAALGDLARLNFAQDYKLLEISQADTDATSSDYLLTLEAKTAGATYAKVLVWVDKRQFEPQRAHYFLASGKLSKVAEFTRNRRVGRGWSVEEQVFAEPNATTRRTRMLIESVTPRPVSDLWFTPRHMELNR
jgi:outer membrane lipoprotein-sorting protein